MAQFANPADTHSLVGNSSIAGVSDVYDWPICGPCGAMFAVDDEAARAALKNCRICEDPRQYVPPQGQIWSSLRNAHGKHSNRFEQDKYDGRLWSIITEPKLGIGQRAILIQTPSGNIMWDCVAYIDDDTVEFIKSKGGLKAIVISHPHFYTTHPVWADAFDCPVYTSIEDEEWFTAPCTNRKLIKGPTETILPGVTAVKCGGHFDGSLVLHYENMLFVADTILPIMSGFNPDTNRWPNKTSSFTFMYSIPNMIPLGPDKIHDIWKAIKPFDFTATYALTKGHEIRHPDVKRRVLESMQIVVRTQGWPDHPILHETCP